eukprot:11618467-Ditylum_brightwellii.AAC.1
MVRGCSCGGGAWLFFRWGARSFLGGVHGCFGIGTPVRKRVAVLGVRGPILWWLACGEREVHRNAILF